MCGIVGYIGSKEAWPILIGGLEKLEYRGYDSSGVVVSTAAELKVVKTKGRIALLEEKIKEKEADLAATLGVGHTRWATHGEPSDVNSHPHMSADGKLALVHNGIIENYLKLKEFLSAKGYHFISETDTEVAVHLLHYYYNGDMLDALKKTLADIEGSYALGIVAKDHPDELWAARKDSPLVVGVGKGENFIASDIPAILEHTRNCYLLEDGEIAKLTRAGVSIFDQTGNPVQKEIFTVNWDIDAAEKGGYDHFMQKEMYEQPKALHDTVIPRIKNGEVDFYDEISLTREDFRRFKKIFMVACGSAWHVSTAAKYIIEKFARIPVEVDLASEFRYRDPIIDQDCLCIIISQSGETADTLAGLREAKARGAHILSIVNVVGSSIARESDDVLYIHAGPEIAVATTKAYSCQLATCYLIAMALGRANGRISDADYTHHLQVLQRLPQIAEQMLSYEPQIKELAAKMQAREDVFYIGRGVDYAVAMEGSLKLKEISYVHGEAYAAGELKHGAISLVTEGMPVVAVAVQDDLFDKMLSNIKEVKARGAFVVAFAKEGNDLVAEIADYVFWVPEMGMFSPSGAVIPMQMLGYYISIERGCDVDKPRNLAKSVTVE